LLSESKQVLPIIRHWKTVTVSVLAALLVFQAAGWFLACGILQFQAKKVAHIALDLPETPLQTVTIPADLLPKIRVGKKEIRLDGRLFDIKNQTVKGDSIRLTLYHDRREQAVLDALGSLLSLGDGSNTAHSLPLQSWLAKWLGSAFLLPVATALALPMDEFFAHFFACLLPVAQTAPSCFSPPPEF
jgi:hypothetical protein